MPFIPNTPESKIARSDSKNPSTTCKGLTTDGKHCRRDIKSQLRETDDGVVAVLDAQDDDHDGAAAYFCWQHKDQAATLVAKTKDGRKANIVPLKGRTSVDTLVERLGIVDLNAKDKSKRKENRHARPARKETLPQTWQDVDGEMYAVRKKAKKKSSSNVGLFCCISARPSSPEPIRTTVVKPARTDGYTKMSSPLPQTHASQTHSPRPQAYYPSSPRPSQSAPNQSGPRPTHRVDHSAPTVQIFRQIPKHLPPLLTSALMAELVKPITPADSNRRGFIYMFWQTRLTSGVPSVSEASTLLDPQTPTKGTRDTVLQKYAAGSSTRSSTATPTANKTVFLKIGSAANVARRLSQWQSQCGYAISLVRYYPTTTSPSSSSPPPNGGQKRHSSTPSGSPLPKNGNGVQQAAGVPCLSKVERLIHMQLAEKRVKRNCETCGKEHREWFEVEATAEAVRAVDEICRWWIGWGLKKERGEV
ncbi:uncharacterized protein KY384_003898 [Bacidia gigantensis]|uniref:uncharacterized protein n=1 Tax=Bacidia gigantensis TaxID=2732470 RepID=UPI001D03922D|nr:uncharacterized protein KY384_003898 [Bacidia gigantensis]KAG8532257.1 hypothetical protein KY384_003898 [Bacidia gigantensis]